MRFCEIPFPKGLVYSDVVLKNLFKAISLSFQAKTRKVADGHSSCVLKFSRPLNYSKLSG